jgi:periplasmic protein CpxP/Spy
MKNLKLFLFILFPVAMLAQQNHHQAMEKFTPQQKAILRAKEIRLQLDLTEEQETQVVAFIEQTIEKQAYKIKAPQDLTQKERYELRLTQLETRLQLQEKMKTILNEEQYATWKKIYKGMRHQRGKKGLDKNRKGLKQRRNMRPKKDYQNS